jgi:hypothetical protein
MWIVLNWINHPIGYIIGGTAIGSLISGDIPDPKNFLIAAILYGMTRHAILPFIRVIICNYRKVPYYGEEGSDRRGSSGSRGD